MMSKGWLDGAVHVPSPNFNMRPPNQTVDLLVIHNISLPPGQFGGGHIEKFFQNRLCPDEHEYFQTISSLQVSSHFLIDRSGQVVQFVNCEDRAWHAGASCHCGVENCNDFSIGIELEGADDIPYESAQYQSLVWLTHTIQTLYPAISNDRIVGHCDISPGRKTDPGESFDWRRYLDALENS